MTEAEWLTSADPTPILEFIRNDATARKLRLFSVAALKKVKSASEENGTETHRKVLIAYELAERFADGGISVQDLRRAWGENLAHCWPERAYEWAREVASPGRGILPCSGISSVDAVALLRDIFGNPFRPVAINPRWLTSNVVNLANAIYSERAFDRLPILSDALMDAGCNDDEILNHCRSEGPHVRGCWVVDLLTGRN